MIALQCWWLCVCHHPLFPIVNLCRHILGQPRYLNGGLTQELVGEQSPGHNTLTVTLCLCFCLFVYLFVWVPVSRACGDNHLNYKHTSFPRAGQARPVESCLRLAYSHSKQTDHYTSPVPPGADIFPKNTPSPQLLSVMYIYIYLRFIFCSDVS